MSDLHVKIYQRNNCKVARYIIFINQINEPYPVVKFLTEYKTRQHVEIYTAGHEL